MFPIMLAMVCVRVTRPSFKMLHVESKIPESTDSKIIKIIKIYANYVLRKLHTVLKFDV